MPHPRSLPGALRLSWPWPHSHSGMAFPLSLHAPPPHTEPRADGGRGVWTRCRLGGEPVQFGSDQRAQHLVRNSVGAVTRFGSQSRFGAGF